MNIFDILLLAVFVFAVIKGYIHGFVMEIMSLAVIVLAIILAKYFVPYTFPSFSEWLNCPEYVAKPIAYLVIFLAIVFLCHFLAKVIERMLKIMMLNQFNMFLGACVSLLKYILIMSLVLNLVHEVNNRTHIFSEDKENSSLMYNPVRKVMPSLLPYVTKEDFE